MKAEVYKIFLLDGGYTTWKEIQSVDKNDIGDQLSHWEQFCNLEVEPYDENFAFWNTYERDWSKSSKSPGDATENDATIYLSSRRRYTRNGMGLILTT